MRYPKPLPGLKNIAPYVGGESELKGFDNIVKLASNEGAFGPKPDCAIFADTGWEPEKVMDHLEWLKSKLSYPVHIVKNHLHSGNIKTDIENEISSERGFLFIPFYAKNSATGKTSLGPRLCTRNYKKTARIWN